MSSDETITQWLSAGERRETSSTGGMKGQKPEQFSLLPWEALGEIAKVYAYGADKYARDNYRKGYNFHLSFDACLRHLSLFWQGQDLDQESGLPHLAHAAFHLNALLVYCGDQERYGLFDDRQTARWPKKD